MHLLTVNNIINEYSRKLHLIRNDFTVLNQLFAFENNDIRSCSHTCIEILACIGEYCITHSVSLVSLHESYVRLKRKFKQILLTIYYLSFLALFFNNRAYTCRSIEAAEACARGA